MRSGFVLATLAAVLSTAAADYLPTKFHCDTVSHLSRKPYVEKSSDLLNGLSQLRLVTVGVTGSQLYAAFLCTCVTQPFSEIDKGPSALIALWQCGQISVAQFSDPAQWSAVQWDEFGARVTAHAEWGQVLEKAWFLSPYHYSRTWFQVDDARPFAMLVSSSCALSATEMQRKIGATGVRPISWADTVPAVALRSFMLQSSQEMQRARYVQKGRDEKASECRATYDLGIQEGERRARDRAPAPPVLHPQRQQPPHSRHLKYTQEDMDAAYARGISVGQSSATPPPAPGVAGAQPCDGQIAIPKAKLEQLLTCPIGLDLLNDPVVNRQSGLTYSRRNLAEWIQNNPTDPQTRAATTADDFVDNIALRHIVELYHEH